MEGKLQLGMKLRVCGAELGGGGPPGEPLEVEGVSHLLLHHNSCSPVPWDERLGLCARLRVMPLRALPDVHAHGGDVLATMVVVRCRYPLQYYERMGDGSSQVRGQKAQDQLMKAWEKTRQDALASAATAVQRREVDFATALLADPRVSRIHRSYAQMVLGHGSPSHDDDSGGGGEVSGMVGQGGRALSNEERRQICNLQQERQALGAAFHLEFLTRVLGQALGMGNPLAGHSNAAPSVTMGGQQYGGGEGARQQQQQQQQQKQAGGGWEAAVAAAVAGQRGSPFLRLRVSAVAPAGWRGGGAG
ncbi:MAG: hypothetical protein WDW38_010759 [Sanguina aurantia]